VSYRLDPERLNQRAATLRAARSGVRPRGGRPSGRWISVIVVVAVLAGLLGGAAVATNSFGAGDKFQRLLRRIELAVNPPPDRASVPTIEVTPPPSTFPTAAPAVSLAPGESAPPPTAAPVRKAVDVRIAADPKAVFAHELQKDWCAPAGTQMVLAIFGQADTSQAFQRELVGRISEWESYGDSHNGQWGPAAIAEALAAYNVPGYVIHAASSRAAALRDAAVAISRTGAPVVLLAWRGAHTWVMTGYRADADPTVFPDANVTGGYILDPWYPWVSSIWGASDPPGTFQDSSEMERNFLPWKRPEGRYPDRDGKFIIVVPTRPLTPPG
jgi:hypothetical protein